jgi:hypothetical protein
VDEFGGCDCDHRFCDLIAVLGLLFGEPYD